jgi:hypothetical protein
MDLIGCPRCNERFLLREARSEGWACPNCLAEMRVVAHRIPTGIVTPDVPRTDRLQHVSRSPTGAPFHSTPPGWMEHRPAA